MIPYKSTTTELIFTGRAIIDSVVLVGGTANSSVVLDNSTDGSGDDFIEIKALAYDSKKFDFEKDGIEFSTGVYSTLSGAGAKVYIYLK